MARSRRADLIPARQLDWLWAGRVPIGSLTVCSGDPGDGKSTIWSDIAARITRGDALPADPRPRQPAGVVWISAEEDADAIIRPRLEAMGADLDRVEIVDDNDGTGIDLIRDHQLIVEAGRRVGAELYVIDTLLRCCRIGSYRASGERLAPLLQHVRRENAAVLGLNHNAKAGRNAAMKSLGSVGILGLARSLLFCGPDPHVAADYHFALAVGKDNYGAAETLRYQTVMLESGIIVLRWGEPDPELDADEIADGTRADRRAVDEAVEILRLVLIERPLRWSELVHACKQHASLSERTFRRARDILSRGPTPQIGRRQIGSGVNSYTVWYTVGLHDERVQSLVLMGIRGDEAAPAVGPVEPDDQDDDGEWERVL